jgi:hypothetical protein
MIGRDLPPKGRDEYGMNGMARTTALFRQVNNKQVSAPTVLSAVN